MAESGEKKKSDKRKIILHIICAVGALVLLIFSIITYGWFTMNKTVEVDDAQMTAVSGKFELASANTKGKYDEYLDLPKGTELTDITVNGETTTKKLTATGNGKPEIKWLMSNESNFGNVNDGDGIQPGSSGTLTFYVIPKQSGELKLKFSLDTILYNNNAKEISAENPDNSECIIVDTEPVAKLVRGHILFFENYDSTTGFYSDRITDSFNYNIQNAQENTAYKVDIYWVWPEVIDQLILPQNDSLLNGKSYKKITADTDNTIINDMKSNSDNYFLSSDNLSDMLENVSKGSSDIGFNQEYYTQLNTLWNMADQQIGLKVAYIELKLNADEDLSDNNN